MNELGGSLGAPLLSHGSPRTAAFWWNAYAVLLVGTVAIVLGVFVSRTVPVLAQQFHAADQVLPLSLRFLIGTSSAFPWVAIAIGVAVFGLRRNRIKMPAPYGVAVLAVAAWLVVTVAIVALTLTVGQLRPLP